MMEFWKRGMVIGLLAAMLTCIFPALGEERPALNLEYRYLGSEDKLYSLGNTGYVVDHISTYTASSFMKQVEQNGADLARLIPPGGDVKVFLYFIETPRSVDLSGDLTGENEIWQQMQQWYQMDGMATLAIDDVNQFMDWFYKTDHHWNYKGSYQGYCDVIRMMLGEEEPLAQPVETVVFEGLKFNGSYSKALGYAAGNEDFAVYRFEDDTRYAITDTDYKVPAYGRQQQYFAGKYSSATYQNHYGTFYGGDVKELVIDSKRQELPNLLIFSNSFSNAINLLLARHFNRVCILDNRYFRSDPLYVQHYIKQNEIDYVLILGDLTHFVLSLNLK